MIGTTMLVSASFCVGMTALGVLLTAQQFKKTVKAKR